MIEIIQNNKVWVILGGLIALVIINKDSLGFLWSWTNRVRSSTSATPSDRANLYESLIETQNLLAKCGVERDKLDDMTLSEVGRVATTGDYEKTT